MDEIWQGRIGEDAEWVFIVRVVHHETQYPKAIHFLFKDCPLMTAYVFLAMYRQRLHFRTSHPIDSTIASHDLHEELRDTQ